MWRDKWPGERRSSRVREKGWGRGVWTLKPPDYIQHISHMCQLWVAPEKIAHLSGRENRSSFTTQIIRSVLYIWTHSKPAYWNLFITNHTGEIDMSHMLPLLYRSKHLILKFFVKEWFFCGVQGSCLSLCAYCLPLASFQSLPLISISPPKPVFFSYALHFPLSPLLCFSAHVCHFPLGAVRANIDLWFGPIPDPPAYALTDWAEQRQPASHQSKRWSDCPFFLPIVFDERRIISTRSISSL